MCDHRPVLCKLMVVPGCALVEFAAKIYCMQNVAWKSFGRILLLANDPVESRCLKWFASLCTCSRCLIPSGSIFSLLFLIQSLPT